MGHGSACGFTGAATFTIACERDRTHFAIKNGSREHQLLLQGNQSMGEIALEAGFTHRSHMARCLRSVLGISPAHVAKLVTDIESLFPPPRNEAHLNLAIDSSVLNCEKWTRRFRHPSRPG
jgi:AraC-like DNA-binding protein